MVGPLHCVSPSITTASEDGNHATLLQEGAYRQAVHPALRSLGA